MQGTCSHFPNWLAVTYTDRPHGDAAIHNPRRLSGKQGQGMTASAKMQATRGEPLAQEPCLELHHQT